MKNRLYRCHCAPLKDNAIIKNGGSKWEGEGARKTYPGFVFSSFVVWRTKACFKQRESRFHFQMLDWRLKWIIYHLGLPKVSLRKKKNLSLCKEEWRGRVLKLVLRGIKIKLLFTFFDKALSQVQTLLICGVFVWLHFLYIFFYQLNDQKTY